MPARAPRAVIGFTTQIRYFMQLSDFFIGKPVRAVSAKPYSSGYP